MPIVTVSREHLFGMWSAGLNSGIDLRDDGTFASAEGIPGDDTWALVDGRRIKLKFSNDPEPRITYRIDRFENNEMDVLIEEQDVEVQFQRVSGESVSPAPDEG